jgi:ribonuclease HI
VNTIEVWTDGSVKSYNKKTGGYGGWAYIHARRYGDKKEQEAKLREEFGSSEGVTSNQMELTAILKGLLALSPEDKENQIVVYSDSAYAVNAFQQNWIQKWENNYWHTKTGKLKNKDLWIPLIYIVRQIPDIKFVHVKGHNGTKYNEEVDQLAQGAAERLRLEKQPDFLEVKRRYNRVRARRRGPMLINKSKYRKED